MLYSPRDQAEGEREGPKAIKSEEEVVEQAWKNQFSLLPAYIRLFEPLRGLPSVKIQLLFIPNLGKIVVMTHRTYGRNYLFPPSLRTVTMTWAELLRKSAEYARKSLEELAEALRPPHSHGRPSIEPAYSRHRPRRGLPHPPRRGFSTCRKGHFFEHNLDDCHSPFGRLLNLWYRQFSGHWKESGSAPAQKHDDVDAWRAMHWNERLHHHWHAKLRDAKLARSKIHGEWYASLYHEYTKLHNELANAWDAWHDSRLHRRMYQTSDGPSPHQESHNARWGWRATHKDWHQYWEENWRDNWHRDWHRDWHREWHQDSSHDWQHLYRRHRRDWNTEWRQHEKHWRRRRGRFHGHSECRLRAQCWILRLIRGAVILTKETLQFTRVQIVPTSLAYTFNHKMAVAVPGIRSISFNKPICDDASLRAPVLKHSEGLSPSPYEVVKRSFVSGSLGLTPARSPKFANRFDALILPDSARPDTSTIARLRAAAEEETSASQSLPVALTAAVDFDLTSTLRLPPVSELTDASVASIRNAVAEQISTLQSMLADISRISEYGELPVSIEQNGSVLRVHFPNSDVDRVSTLAEDKDVQSGQIVPVSSSERGTPPVEPDESSSPGYDVLSLSESLDSLWSELSSQVPDLTEESSSVSDEDTPPSLFTLI